MGVDFILCRLSSSTTHFDLSMSIFKRDVQASLRQYTNYICYVEKQAIHSCARFFALVYQFGYIHVEDLRIYGKLPVVFHTVLQVLYFWSYRVRVPQSSRTHLCVSLFSFTHKNACLTVNQAPSQEHTWPYTNDCSGSYVLNPPPFFFICKLNLSLYSILYFLTFDYVEQYWITVWSA